MGLRDLVMGRPACAALGSSSSSSSSNPLSSFADTFIGYSPKSEDVPLSTVPGEENELELDQGSTRSIKGADFVNGHHGDACGDNFQTSILSVPELRGIEPDLQELEQIDRATSMNFNPKFDGPPEMGLPELLRPSPFQPNNVLAHQPGEHLQGLGIDRLVISTDELSGSWLSFLGIALSHLGGLSQPRFFDEPIKWHEQVIGHRVWIAMEGLQQRSGWSVKIEATRGSLFDVLGCVW